MEQLFIPSIFLLFLNSIYCQSQNVELTLKNVLFLASDDLRPMLGCYADSHPGFDAPPMYTPNLDELAKRSILFERAYAQQAICSPSRTSLLTSRRPDTTRVTDLQSYFRTYGGNFTTIPQFFKENGYYTVGVGKIFHGGTAASGPEGDDYPMSWSEKPYHAKENYGPRGDSWSALTPEQFIAKTPQDTVEAEYAINKLRDLAENAKSGTQPFFLAVGVHKPHLPFVFPEEFLSHYPLDLIHEPDNPYVPDALPLQAWFNFEELRRYRDTSNAAMGIPDLGEVNITYPFDKIRELRRAYYAAVSYADYSLGEVLNELTNLGLVDNTIIVFWGDHGWQLGEHAEWCKQTNFDIATHTPLMISVPGLTTDGGGIRTSKLTELVDIFPTLVEVVGFDPLDICPLDSNEVILCTEGSNLVPLINSPDTSDWKEAVFWQYPRGETQEDHIPSYMGYSIRTDEHHYTEWVSIKTLGGHKYEPDWDNPCDHSELYDLNADRKENINLYDHPEYEEIKIELSRRLRDGWRFE